MSVIGTAASAAKNDKYAELRKQSGAGSQGTSAPVVNQTAGNQNLPPQNEVDTSAAQRVAPPGVVTPKVSPDAATPNLEPSVPPPSSARKVLRVVFRYPIALHGGTYDDLTVVDAATASMYGAKVDVLERRPEVLFVRMSENHGHREFEVPACHVSSFELELPKKE